MTFEKAVEEIKKSNKVKHKSWDSLMVTEFSNNIVCLEDKRSYYYPLLSKVTDTDFNKHIEKLNAYRNGKYKK